MSKLGVKLEGSHARRPGEMLRGVAEWELRRLPRAVEIRLIWFIDGQGVGEARCVHRIRVDRPQQHGRHEFEVPLPSGPCSYDGPLTFLRWALEVVALPDRSCARVVFAMAPEGIPVRLFPLGDE